MSIRERLIVLLALVMVCIGGVSAYFMLQKEVAIVIDGRTQIVHTFKGNVNEILKEAQVVLYPKDNILPTLSNAVLDQDAIRIVRAVPVTLVVDGKSSKVITVPVTVESALKLAGISLSKFDYSSKPLASKITSKDVIRITRAVPVTLVADGKSNKVITVPVTVKSVLKLAGISLGKFDYASKSLTSKIVANETIKITRVTRTFVKRRSVLNSLEERRPDPSLEKGITHIVRKGSDGVSEKTVRITYEDGKEIDRAIIESKIIKKPVSRLIAMGTLSSVSRGGSRVNFERTVVVEATAYTHTGYRTASGAYPEVGMIAVDPRVIPMGSKVYVEGYGFARAKDTGGAIKGNRIDLFMDNYSNAIRWGRRTVKVYIVD